MIVTLRSDADPARVRRELVARGLWIQPLTGGDGAHVAVSEHSAHVDPDELRRIVGVASVSVAPSAHPRVDAQRAVTFGRAQPPSSGSEPARRSGDDGRITLSVGSAPVLMAGPCCVESAEQVERIAAQVARGGARVLRGGAFKPRTSPYAFAGHGRAALGWMRDAADRHGLAVVTEAMSSEDAPAVAEVADLVQVGSRNMHDYALLRAVAGCGKPVLLKRGMAATVEEWLLAAEHLLVHGASGVVFCERGIRSFDPTTRNVLDVGAVALLAHVHGQPVVVDPSHAAGRRDLVPSLARAGLAAGACGLLVEAHDDAGAALSDGPQAIHPDELATMCGGTP
ncbi:MAG: 3-deoxy-7-phosphoheptulonate synthase [Deltaproteobacteria bacterium]|nr:3-deoxy-7-phosphoheptulonate synthase [Deltaproteobacteria bacterium]